MRTKMKWLAAIGMILVLLLSVCALAAEQVAETLSVSVSTKGTPPETPETYTVRLTADGDFPMPEGSQNGVYDLQVKGAASASFPKISYDRPGVYTYTVQQVPGTQAGVKYDDSVFNVKVQVYNNATWDGFEIVTAIRRQGNTEKTSIGFVNIYPAELVSKTVQKNWDDNGDQDGIRPDQLTATLTSSEKMTPVTVTLNAANNWTATVEDLPRFKEDTRDEITYTWAEGATDSNYSYDGTTTDGDITVITNKHVPETIDVSVEKIWIDADDQDGIRPEGETTLRVTLLADGETIRNVLLSEANGWKASISGLPKYEKGKEISYTWEEKNPPTGYTLTGNATRKVEGGQLTTLENTHTVATTSATIVKNWEDAENQDGIRPESISVTLSNGTAVTLNAENNWRATVENLPKYENGKEIVYTWKETTAAEGYELTDSSVNGTITVITNTHTPVSRRITIRKIWDDEDDKDGLRVPVTLVLTASANQTAVATYTWVVEDDDTLEHTFTVPEYYKGTKLSYTVDEPEVPNGYLKTVDNGAMTVTNRHEPDEDEFNVPIDIQITKSWVDDGNRDGIRPENIVVKLLRNGEDAGTVTLTGTGDLWTYTVTGLPKYAEDGTENVYTIAEMDVPGYTSEIRDFAIINTHETETTARTVAKVWNDNNNANRPAAITVALNADGKATGKTVTLNAENNWTATIDNLPVNENGRAIVYTWTEGEIAGYRLSNTAVTATEGGELTTLTNTPITNPPPANYRLTIYYRYVNGREAAPTYQETLHSGDNYDVVSPVIAGYRASIMRVTGTMPSHDVEYLVLYIPGDEPFETITEYDVPLGIGSVYINIGECFE